MSCAQCDGECNGSCLCTGRAGKLGPFAKAAAAVVMGPRQNPKDPHYPGQLSRRGKMSAATRLAIKDKLMQRPADVMPASEWQPPKAGQADGTLQTHLEDQSSTQVSRQSVRCPTKGCGQPLRFEVLPLSGGHTISSCGSCGHSEAVKRVQPSPAASAQVESTESSNERWNRQDSYGRGVAVRKGGGADDEGDAGVRPMNRDTARILRAGGKRPQVAPCPSCQTGKLKVELLSDVVNPKNSKFLETCPDCGYEGLRARAGVASPELGIEAELVEARKKVWAQVEGLGKSMQVSKAEGKKKGSGDVELDHDRRRVKAAIFALLKKKETPYSADGKVNLAKALARDASLLPQKEAYKKLHSEVHGLTREVAGRAFVGDKPRHFDHETAAFFLFQATAHLHHARRHMLQEGPSVVDRVRSTLSLQPLFQKHLSAADTMLRASRNHLVRGDTAMYAAGQYAEPTEISQTGIMPITSSEMSVIRANYTQNFKGALKHRGHRSWLDLVHHEATRPGPDLLAKPVRLKSPRPWVRDDSR
jgi:hypothetical protein